MPNARLLRRVRFSARHHYNRSAWSAERNHAVFGDQTEPHAHDWLVQVAICGPIDPSTGFVTDLSALDAALDAVCEGWDGGNLNELIPEVRSGSLQPSTEALARWLFERLRGHVPAPARLERVWMWESPELGAAFPA